jgi:hypothetical protein
MLLKPARSALHVEKGVKQLGNVRTVKCLCMGLGASEATAPYKTIKKGKNTLTDS